MERVLSFLQRLYWLVLVVIVLVFSLANLDLLRARGEAEFLFGRFAFRGFWLLGAVVLAFLIEALLSSALVALARRRAARLAQELDLKVKAGTGGSPAEAEEK
jgi:uncharacterized integral membrane protein